jgi:hypothetical protein
MCCERRHSRWLCNHGVPHGERRGKFPCEDQHREVPRDDHADDAERLAERHECPVGSSGNGLPVDLVDRTGVELEGSRRRIYLAESCRDRLSRVLRFDRREHLPIACDGVAYPHQYLTALHRVHRAPYTRRESRSGGFNGTIDIRCVSQSDRCDGRSICRIHDVLGLAGVAAGSDTVDEHAFRSHRHCLTPGSRRRR